MPRTIRFHLDEDTDPAIAAASAPRDRCDDIARNALRWAWLTQSSYRMRTQTAACYSPMTAIT